MKLFGIHILSLAVAAFSCFIVISELRTLTGLIFRKFDSRFNRYRLTRLSYAYFLMESVVGVIFGTLAGTYYTLYLSGINYENGLFDFVAVSMVSFALVRIVKPLIDKAYLIKDDTQVKS